VLLDDEKRWATKGLIWFCLVMGVVLEEMLEGA